MAETNPIKIELNLSESKSSDSSNTGKLMKAITDALSNFFKNIFTDSSKNSNLQKIQEETNWATIAENINNLSVKTLQDVRDKFNKFLSDNQNDLDSKTTKEISDSIDKLDKGIMDKNPLEDIKNSYNEYKKACEEVSEAQRELIDLEKAGSESKEQQVKATKKLIDAEIEQQKSQANLNKGINSMGKSGSDLVKSGQEIVTMLDNLGVKVPDSISKVLGGLGQVMNGLGSIDITKPFSIISSVTSIVSGIGNAVAGIFGGGKKEVSKDTVAQYNSLVAVLEKVIAKQKEAMLNMTGSEAIKQAEDIKGNIKKEVEAAKNIGKEYLNSNASLWTSSFGTRTKNALNKYKNEINRLGIDFDALGGRATGLFDLSPEQLKKLREELPEAWEKIDENAKTYLDTIIESEEKTKELDKQLKQTLTGITFDSAKDSLKKLLLDADTTMENVAKNFNDYMRNAIVGIIVDGILNDRIASWYERFAEAMGNDNKLDDKEKEDLQQLYNGIYTDALDLVNNAYDAAGIATPQASPTPTSGAGLAPITQDSANQLNGSFDNMLRRTDAIADATSQALLVQQAMNSTLYTIAGHTAHLINIDSAIEDIKIRGIKMKA
jgi:hypothetical protein